MPTKETLPPTPILHYWAFDWCDESTSLISAAIHKLDPDLKPQFLSLLPQNRATFFAHLPLPVKNLLEDSLRRNLLSYLWETVGNKTGLFPFRYVINHQSASPTQITPFADKYHHRDFLDVFAKSPLSRPDEILDSVSFNRRFDLRIDQIIGLHRAREHMLACSPGDLIFWISPPGKPIDGYPGFTIIFFAQKLPDKKTIDCHSLIVNLDLAGCAALINSFLPPENRLPEKASLPDILHRAVLVKSNGDNQVNTSSIVSVLENLLSPRLPPPIHTPQHPVDLDKLLALHLPFINSQIQAFLEGQSPARLQTLLQSFNRQNISPTISTTGDTAISCGLIDFGRDPRTLPGQNRASVEAPFSCPACNRIINPCLACCPNCGATKDNYREVKRLLDSPLLPKKPGSLAPRLPGKSVDLPHPPLLRRVSPHPTPDPHPYHYLIIGLSVLKLHVSKTG